MEKSYEKPIYVVTLIVKDDDVERVLVLLRGQWGGYPVQYSSPDDAFTSVSMYFEDEVAALLAGAAWSAKPGVHSHSESSTKAKDWKNLFRGQFSIREIGEKLRICPVWEKENVPDDNRINLWVDPGLSFGTGEHFTTAFCLEMIDRIWFNSVPGSFIDVGTGSGLLAIAGARLGCPNVLAIERDRGLLPYAKENFVRNHISDCVELKCLDIEHHRITGCFEVVCANLISKLLVDCAPILVEISGTMLVLSGIRELEADRVAETYLQLGGREIIRRSDGEWTGLVFEFERN